MGRAGRTALGGVAGIVAYSRVHIGVHYPSDVAGGLLIGRAFGRLWAARCPRACCAPADRLARHEPRRRHRLGDRRSDPDRRRFAISPHGIGIAVGYLAGSWWMLREGRKRGLGEDDMSNVLLRALIGAILGARFFYVLAHFGEFDRAIDMLKIWEGGISLIGGIFGAIIAAYPYMLKHRMGFLRTMDSAAIGIAFGILFGRVGDLIIGDHLGKPTSWALGLVYKGGAAFRIRVLDDPREVLRVFGRPVSGGRANGAFRHAARGEQPAAVRASGSTRRRCTTSSARSSCSRSSCGWPAGAGTRAMLIAVFGLWYGAMRVLTDFLRVDKRFFGLTGSQWASAAVALICRGGPREVGAARDGSSPRP